MPRTSLAALAVRFYGGARNPGGPPDGGVAFLEWLQGNGVNLAKLTPRQYDAAAEALGMDELQRQQFIEDAASWLGDPLT